MDPVSAARFRHEGNHHAGLRPFSLGADVNFDIAFVGSFPVLFFWGSLMNPGKTFFAQLVETMGYFGDFGGCTSSAP